MNKLLIIILFLAAAHGVNAQTADPTMRQFQHFKANVPFNFEDSTDFTVIYQRPPISQFTKEYRPTITYTMRTTDFDIKEEERKIFTQQLIKEFIGKKGKLVQQNLIGDKAEFWYTQIEKKITYRYKVVVKFDTRRFVIIHYKDLNKKTLFEEDVQYIFDSIEFI